jgi:hypothetical protein
MAAATYHFLSFVRSGFAAAITRPDSLGEDQPALATAPVGVMVSGVATPVTHGAVVQGPGDVIGIDASQVVRTDPIEGAVGIEPNYLAQIEFDRPDLPWLFTPAAAAGERLRPWIVLVVVDLEGPQRCMLSPSSPLPQLRVPAAASGQLPALESSYLWAHAQVVTPGGESVSAALEGDPRLSVSRLICPRHLAPFKWYLAAVVPAFEVGRLAGLGQAVTPEAEAKLEPAWQPGGEAVLPVYHSFRFRTGEEADFESLARRLEGRPLPSGVGTRSLDVSRPGAGLPMFPPPLDVHDTQSIAWLDGALRPIDSDALPQRDAAADQAFKTSLTVLLDRPAALLRGGEEDPVVAPPIYGDKHAFVVELGAGAPPPWIRELNLDSRARIAAALGTQVVQARQEDLIARAWRQLGDVLAANRLLRKAQLARSGSLRVHERLSTLDPATVLAIAAPAHKRVAGIAGAAVTVAKAVHDSRLPDVAVEPAFRRLARAGAVIARTAEVSTLADAVVSRFVTDAFLPPVAGPDGVSSMRPASEVIGPAQASATLAALGDTLSSDPSRLDTIIATLAASGKPLPSGDEIRAGTPRADIGAVAVVTGLGAVTADAVSALLAATSPATGTIHPPLGRIRPPRGPTHAALGPMRRGPGQPLGAPPVPRGLAGRLGADAAITEIEPRVVIGRSVFVPYGGEHVLGEETVLLGGTVVITSDVVHQIVSGSVNVGRVDDERWAGLGQASVVPAVLPAADPIADPGSRLNAFRRDPAAISALADVADGRLNATMALDAAVAGLSTTGAAHTSLESLTSGAFTVPLPQISAGVTGPTDVDAAMDIVAASAAAFDRIVSTADAPPAPLAPVFDLDTARSGLLAKIDPETTLPTRVRARLDVHAIVGVAPRDELDPVMACPQFLDPMWEAVRDLGHGWLLPGLELVPPDTATLVRTNPSFVAAHMVGLNHEFMRELLWRGFPTDQLGTAFKRWWDRSGGQTDDIGPVHLFAGRLVDNLLAGKDGEAVLLLRSELLRRYPGSIVYLCRATRQNGELALEDETIVLPTFRGDLPPDVTFVGFPITPDVLRASGDPWWFVIAQPPSEPRFGLDEPSDDTPEVPISASELAWSHMSSDGNALTPAPFVTARPRALQGHPIDGLTWGASAAVQAHLLYQRPVRVAIRAYDLLPAPNGPPPDGSPPGEGPHP